MSDQRIGYEAAVKNAIDLSEFAEAREFHRGMAFGLYLCCGVVTREQWEEDNERILSARKAAA